jgi:hypothetical protein
MDVENENGKVKETEPNTQQQQKTAKGGWQAACSCVDFLCQPYQA